jgi:GNAT superfamily N-acetyltransferase
MSEQRSWTAEPLTVGHEVDGFDCGSIRETTWLRLHGLSVQHSGSSRTYVLRRLGDGRVVGFHALATGAILPLEARARVTDGGGADPLSVIVLTHLGVDLAEQGQSLGRYLLMDALRRVNAAADLIGAKALLLHTADARARGFYLALAEFEASPTDPLHLLLSIKDLRHSLAVIQR